MIGTTEKPVTGQTLSAPSFSLVFAIPRRINGEDVLSTTPGSDGTIGGNTPYTTNDDGKEKSDDSEDYDER